MALLLLFSHTILEAVQAASAFLMLFSAMTALALFRVRRLRVDAVDTAVRTKLPGTIAGAVSQRSGEPTQRE